MAYAGQELHNPSTGQRTVFHQTARGTRRGLLRLEWQGGPDWAAGPKHVHRLQEERFEVLSGQVRARVAGEERSHRPGDVFAAPPGASHTVWSEGDEDVRLLVEFRPALRSEDVLETPASLAAAGRTRERRAEGRAAIRPAGARVRGRAVPAHPPLAVQRAVFGPLAWLADRRGRRAALPHPPAGGRATGTAVQPRLSRRGDLRGRRGAY
jgi:mannose-6-phosphate isomerase-like protein (cupin superfamily)